MLVLALLAIGVLGCVLLWAGLRGTRIDDHPVCRKCTFDLSGIQLGYATCPECGTQLTQDQIVRGNRKRRPLVVASGAFLALPLILSGLLLFASPASVVRALPNQSLVWFAQLSGDRTAVNELAVRMTAKSLTRVQAESLVQSALTRQADILTPWLEDWGDIVDEAILRGWVSDDDLERYLKQAVTLYMTMSPRANVGSVPIHEFRFVGSGPDSNAASLGRVGSQFALRIERASFETVDWPLVAQTFRFTADTNSPSVYVLRFWSDVAPTLWPLRDFPDDPYVFVLSSSPSSSGLLTGGPQQGLPDVFPQLGPIIASPGAHTVEVIVSVYARHPNDARQRWFKWQVPLSHKLEVRAKDELLVDLILDAARNAEIRRNVVIRVQNRGSLTNFEPQLSVTIPPPSIAVCMTAELWTENVRFFSTGLSLLEYPENAHVKSAVNTIPMIREHPAGTITAPKTVRVVLSPAPNWAATNGMLEIAGLPMVFEDVPVESPGATP